MTRRQCRFLDVLGFCQGAAPSIHDCDSLGSNRCSAHFLPFLTAFVTASKYYEACLPGLILHFIHQSFVLPNRNFTSIVKFVLLGQRFSYFERLLCDAIPRLGPPLTIMSANAVPISPVRPVPLTPSIHRTIINSNTTFQHAFAEALQDLPTSTLYNKAAELRNSINHLTASNAELQKYADDHNNDADCLEAVKENDGTIKRMEERIELVKAEVERKGLRWDRALSGEADDGSEGISTIDQTGRTPQADIDSLGEDSLPASADARLLALEAEGRQNGTREHEDDSEGMHL
jgi:hypothetical protein